MTVFPEPVLMAEGVTKIYTGAEAPVEALRGVSLSLVEGEFVAVVGPSGCGKSTLLHISGAMDRPTAGRIAVGGHFLDQLDDDGLTELRRRRIGFVFQFFNLLPTLTVLENIALPLLLTGAAPPAATAAARTVSERVGVSGRLTHFPRQLSGGEAQRVAIARAVVHRPLLVIADEPTGNLDSVTGAQVLHLLAELNREHGVTVLLATHAAHVAASAGRVVHMRDGRIERDEGGGR
ncbi:MAG: ABC transporter ATP-binding protein [Acidobacteria bacterium]|jgi:putative ABC transport system ATP-binding protein|nr:MAG: ABC transporter ATP-binding protein [Acidobacteriota bacterium]